jgi:hypothetical protein
VYGFHDATTSLPIGMMANPAGRATIATKSFSLSAVTLEKRYNNHWLNSLSSDKRDAKEPEKIYTGN